MRRFDERESFVPFLFAFVFVSGKSAFCIYVLLFTRGVCAQDADKIHSLLLLLLLLGTYLPARARKQSSSGRRSIECGVKEKTASCAGAEEASRARRRCRMNRTGFRTKTTGRRKKEERRRRRRRRRLR